ncbi:MAG: ABC transporter permease [Dokdonella sp.]|uniref:ABC transporter permease n=1 Tax=Dokdonella sp. TaxID=2291710 RepID=UPI0032651723
MAIAVLVRRFVVRELTDRFAGSVSGAMWALLQPLLQLAITAFVFVHVFKARVPGDSTIGYVPFLALALWPWVAFSEAVLRSTTKIVDNAALIGKVALPREVLILASVGASFAVHTVGFIAVVLVLAVTRQGIHLEGLVPSLLLFVPLAGLALGIALICASIQVFVRDLVLALGQLLPLMMFAAPVYYDREQLPEQYRRFLDFNPFTFYAESFRALLLDHGTIGVRSSIVAVLLSVVALVAGRWIFRRLDSHFEDFL